MGARRSSFGQSWTCRVVAPLLYFTAVRRVGRTGVAVRADFCLIRCASCVR